MQLLTRLTIIRSALILIAKTNLAGNRALSGALGPLLLWVRNWM
jgi:hypothetical protein